MNKRILAGLAAAVMTFGMCGCSNSGSSESGAADSTPESSAAVNESSTADSAAESTESTENSSQTDEPQPETYEEYYEIMKQKSLCSLGNTAAMKKVIEKAKNGEELTLSFIGGSITEGYTVNAAKCYAANTYIWFMKQYGTNGEKVHYVNAGLSGTPSILGSFRLERDVLANDPDVLFIEFAVNDGTDINYLTAYEGIIRSAYAKNPDIAIVLLFARTEDGYTAQDGMKKIGEYYELPMISYADGITYLMDNGQLTWKEFSKDGSHPNLHGHEMVTDMISYYFEQVEAAQEPSEYVYPEEPMYSEQYVNCHILESDALTPESLGSWEAGSNINTFDKGWTFKGSAESNEPIVFKAKGTDLYLLFKENSAGSGMGSVKVTCTDESGNAQDTLVEGETSGGWGDPTVASIAAGDESHEYTISIEMLEGTEDKEFQILGLGYKE